MSSLVQKLQSYMVAWAPLRCKSRNCSHAARISGAPVVAKRLECVELAPAFNDPRRSTAGASSTHSTRFARFGCGFAALRLCVKFHCIDTAETVDRSHSSLESQLESGFAFAREIELPPSGLATGARLGHLAQQACHHRQSCRR